MRILAGTIGLSLALAACTTVPSLSSGGGGAPPATAPPRAAVMPTAPLELGDLSTGALAIERRFSNVVANRYPAGAALPAIEADLRRSGFACAPPASRRGDPPAKACRRMVRAQGCGHTFQVHLFDQGRNGRLARVRALYDRQCGGDGLLGGPGRR
jgi:hypothetical protein